MSRFTVYWPEELDSQPADVESPVIVAFPQKAGGTFPAADALDVVTRARLMFQNRRCRDCGYPVVEPIELQDSAMNRNGKAIPGSATLIGFRCKGCESEWSI